MAKILVSSISCDPSKGSESGVGWNWACQISRYHEVWVLTWSGNQKPIEQALVHTPMPRVHWVYVDVPILSGFWDQSKKWKQHLYYYLWQLKIFQVAKRLHRQVRFDLSHHTTTGIDWMPSFLPFLPVPFVWGPFVGAQSTSSTFYQTFHGNARFEEQVRTWVRRISKVDVILRLALKKTRLCLASTQESVEHLQWLGAPEVAWCPSVALSRSEVKSLSSLECHAKPTTIRFLSIGNLLAFKGFDLALQAFASVSQLVPYATWCVIGDGPERSRLTEQSRMLGVEDRVTFLNHLTRQEVLGRLSECDVFVFPCLRGAISMACLEVMAAGCPVICLDRGGPGLQVTEETGIKIPANDPEQVVQGLTKAMTRLAQDPGLRAKMGRAGQQRVRDHFLWESRGDWIDSVYKKIVASPEGIREEEKLQVPELIVD